MAARASFSAEARREGCMDESLTAVSGVVKPAF